MYHKPQLCGKYAISGWFGVPELRRKRHSFVVGSFLDQTVRIPATHLPLQYLFDSGDDVVLFQDRTASEIITRRNVENIVMSGKVPCQPKDLVRLTTCGTLRKASRSRDPDRTRSARSDGAYQRL